MEPPLSKRLVEAAIKPLKGYRVVRRCGHDTSHIGITKPEARKLAQTRCPDCQIEVESFGISDAEARRYRKGHA